MTLPASARISVARLRPDDVIVIEHDEPLTTSMAENIKRMAESVWPGRKVLVLSDGLRLKIAQG